MVTETCTEKVKRVTADGDREPFIEKLKCIIEKLMASTFSIASRPNSAERISSALSCSSL